MFEQFFNLDTSVLHAGYLQPVLALLVACLLLLPLLERLGVSSVLGYLIAGLMVGPSGLDLVTPTHELDVLADMGVVFLLFIIGLNLSWLHFAAMRQFILRVGMAQVVITGLFVAAIAWQWDHSAAVTALLGLSFALSSTAIVSQYLLDGGALKTEKGHLVMSILLAQDLAVPILLVMANAFGQNNHETLSLLLLATFIKAVIAITLVFGLGRFALRPLHNSLHKRSRTPEITVALTFLAILVSATVTGMAGLSKELGAFLAGLMLADSGFQDRIHRDIRPFQGILLGLFFITVGMQIDIGEVLHDFYWILASVLGLLVCKAGIIAAICRIAHIPLYKGLPTGVLLAQGSEFVFVIVGAAMASKLMPEDVGQFMLLVTAFSMLCTPLYISLSETLEKRLKPLEAPAP